MNAQRPGRHPQAVAGHGRSPLCLLDAVEVALVVRVPGPAVSAAVAADGGRKRRAAAAAADGIAYGGFWGGVTGSVGCVRAIRPPWRCAQIGPKGRARLRCPEGGREKTRPLGNKTAPLQFVLGQCGPVEAIARIKNGRWAPQRL